MNYGLRNKVQGWCTPVLRAKHIRTVSVVVCVILNRFNLNKFTLSIPGVKELKRITV